MFPCREEIGNRGFFEDHELLRVLDHYGDFRPSRFIFSLQKPFRGRKKAYRVTENFAGLFDFRCSIYKKNSFQKLEQRERERERERDTLGRGNIFPHSIKFHPIFPLITTTAKRGWPQSRKSSQSYKSQLEYVSNRNYIFFIRLILKAFPSTVNGFPNFSYLFAFNGQTYSRLCVSNAGTTARGEGRGQRLSAKRRNEEAAEER